MTRQSRVLLGTIVSLSLIATTSAFAATPEEMEAKCRAEANQKDIADWSEEDKADWEEEGKEDWIQICVAEAERDEPPPPSITNPGGQQ